MEGDGEYVRNKKEEEGTTNSVSPFSLVKVLGVYGTLTNENKGDTSGGKEQWLVSANMINKKIIDRRFTRGPTAL